MIIGICQVQLRMPGCRSLKDKRKIIRSIIDRTKKRFNVSIAEVERQDTWQSAVLGIACVNTRKSAANAVIDRIIDLIEQSDAELVNYHIDWL